jgi:N-methylhydantoinase A
VMAEARRMQGQGDITLRRSASMHHVGQGYEIRVELPASPVDGDDEAAMRTAFYDRYKQEYGYVDPDSAIEVTDWYLIAVIVGSRAGSTLRLDNAVRGGAAVIGRRPAWFPEIGGMTECPIIDRYAMPPGEVFAGPALIEERESTTVVLPGDTASISVHGNLIIEIGGPR